MHKIARSWGTRSLPSARTFRETLANFVNTCSSTPSAGKALSIPPLTFGVKTHTFTSLGTMPKLRPYGQTKRSGGEKVDRSFAVNAHTTDTFVCRMGRSFTNRSSGLSFMFSRDYTYYPRSSAVHITLAPSFLIPAYHFGATL